MPYCERCQLFERKYLRYKLSINEQSSYRFNRQLLVWRSQYWSQGETELQQPHEQVIFFEPL